MLVLVTGGRKYRDKDKVFKVLDRVHACRQITTIIHGDAKGADRFAGEWAESKGVIVRKFPADWRTHGRYAGAVRNQEMVNIKPHLVVAFPGGSGTANCISKAKKKGLKILIIKGAEESNTGVNNDV